MLLSGFLDEIYKVLGKLSMQISSWMFLHFSPAFSVGRPVLSMLLSLNMAGLRLACYFLSNWS